MDSISPEFERKHDKTALKGKSENNLLAERKQKALIARRRIIDFIEACSDALDSSMRAWTQNTSAPKTSPQISRKFFNRLVKAIEHSNEPKEIISSTGVIHIDIGYGANFDQIWTPSHESPSFRPGHRPYDEPFRIMLREISHPNIRYDSGANVEVASFDDVQDVLAFCFTEVVRMHGSTPERYHALRNVALSFGIPTDDSLAPQGPFTPPSLAA